MNTPIPLLLLFILCGNGSVLSELELQEQRILETYNRCMLDSHCTSISNNSFCFDNDADHPGKCKCRDGYELLERNRTHFSCLKHAGFGEACEADVQCQILLSQNAICDQTCRCADNAHRFTDGRCYASLLLGEICQSDGNCWMVDGSFGNCVAGRCICKFDRQVPNTERTNCINARKLGDTCTEDIECSITENAVCRSSCKCAVGYSLSRNEKKCLKAATQFGDPCEEEDQCSSYLEGGTCSNGNCTCPYNQHGFGSRCVRTVLIGKSCIAQDECIPNDKYKTIADCLGGICQCLNGAVDEFVGCSASWNGTLNVLFVVGSLVCIFLNY